jgi:tight adherence protein B
MIGRFDAPVFATVCVVVAVVVAAVASRPQQRRFASGDAGAPARPARVLEAWSLRRSRRRSPDARAVAAWCDDIARRLRSGSTLRDAVATVPSDPATEWSTEALRLAIDRGASVVDALARVDGGGVHLRLALGVISTASRIGGPSAASIDRVAMLLRQRASDLDERATQAAQARLSSHVMTAMPLLMLAALVATDDDVRAVATSPIGGFCIATGLALNVAGWWWMRRIVGVPS